MPGVPPEALQRLAVLPVRSLSLAYRTPCAKSLPCVGANGAKQH